MMSHYKNYKNSEEGYITEKHDIIKLILNQIKENDGQNGSFVALELYQNGITLESIKNDSKYENVTFFIEKNNTYTVYEKRTKYIYGCKISSINKISEYTIIYL